MGHVSKSSGTELSGDNVRKPVIVSPVFYKGRNAVGKSDKSFDPILDVVCAAKIRLLMDMPFIGQMATRLTTIDASTWCATAATDGKNFYFNREFFKKLTRPEQYWVVGHETYHVVFDHVGRRGSRDKDLWNMACDYFINYVLEIEEVGKRPDGVLYDAKFADMSADDIYEILKKSSITIKMPPNAGQHLEMASGDDGEGSGDEGEGTSVTIVGKDGVPTISKADIDNIRNQIKAAVIQTAQSVMSSGGKVPAGVRRMIQELTSPVMDWRSLLDATLRSAIKCDYTFQRRSRRKFGNIILPGQDVAEKVKAAFALDASGSTTALMLRDFLSEAVGVVESFGDYELHVFAFDTEVYNHVIITPENVDDLLTYEIKGAGGTLFPTIYEFMKREDIVVDRLVILTDGLPNSDDWGDPHYCDTLFVIHSNPKINAPHGTTCHYLPQGKAR